MTAAHCFEDCSSWHGDCSPGSCKIKDYDDFEILVGKHDYEIKGDEITRRISDFYPHPEYAFTDASCPNGFGLANDFALLKLRLPIDLTQRIATAAYLPTKGDDYKGKFPPRTNLVASGWGALQNFGGAPLFGPVCPAEKLNAVQLQPIPDSRCRQKVGDSFNASNMICAGPLGSGVCTGDSGGPLVWLDKNEDKVKFIGATSFGTLPCALESPPVFSRITATLESDDKQVKKWIGRVRDCNEETCGKGWCMKGSDLDSFVKSYFFEDS